MSKSLDRPSNANALSAENEAILEARVLREQARVQADLVRLGLVCTDDRIKYGRRDWVRGKQGGRNE